MRVGFTGTRERLTKAQITTMREFLRALRPSRGDHGDCVGGDTAFHVAIRELDVPVTLHPPTNAEFRAYVWVSEKLGDVVCPEKGYLERDQDIARSTDFLLVCPKGPEAARSGTWFTVRCARNRKKTIVIVWPDGSTTLEFYP